MTARVDPLEEGDDAAEDFGLGQTVPPTAPEGAGARAQTGKYAQGAIVASKYQLASILGEGGMGSVWVAKNRTLDLDVALKLMRAELADDVDGVSERMLQEARAAASIGHPAIVQVYDFGFSELGDPFIVMELLRGQSLAEAIRGRDRVRPKRALQILLPIVDALGAAHSRGIVHRDMKPENIFLARLAGNRLQPKVLDFGIAKLEQRAVERITRDGAVIGSPAYMAPEQLRGEPDVDARADIWALCVVLYQVLTGRRPFEGDSYHASMWNVLNAEPRAIAEHGVDEPELWAILQRGFAKTKQARYPDAKSFGRALAEWLIERGVNEDITDASLKSWLGDAAGDAALHSFFPSLEPSLRKPVETAAESPVVPPGAAGSGTRRIGASLAFDLGKAEPEPTRPRAVASALPQRRILWVTALSAVVAFVGAALYAVAAGDADEDPHEVSEPVRSQPRPRKVAPPAAPVARPLPFDGVAPQRPVEEPEVASRVSEAPREAPRSRAPATATPTQRNPTTRPQARGARASAELKNPFQ